MAYIGRDKLSQNPPKNDTLAQNLIPFLKMFQNIRYFSEICHKIQHNPHDFLS
jgi:hypothetical protein